MRSRASIIVIGGGAAGTSVAYHLGEMGEKDVLLLEQSRIASGASSKSNNIVERQFVDEFDILLRVKAFEILHLFFSKMGVPFHKIGYLRLTNSREDVARYEGALKVQRRLGIHDSRVLELDEVKKMFPFLNVEGLVGAQFGPSDGKTDGKQLTRAYAREARKHSVTLLEHTRVNGLKQSGDQMLVITNRGDVKCDTLVNATGPQSAGIANLLGLSMPIKTVRRQTALFESNLNGAGMLPTCVDMSTGFYVYGSGQGTSVFAGLVMNEEADPDNYDGSLDSSYLERLSRAMSFRAPGLRDVRRIGGWAGVLDVTPDSRPIIGPHPDMPAFVNCTMGGFGIQLSPIIGKLIAEMIVYGKPLTISDVSKLKIERFHKSRKLRGSEKENRT